MSEPDILIVGGGLAGLFCALKLAPLPVAILAAAPIGEGSSSVWAQGGIAAAVSEGDSPELHAADTLAAGAGIVDGETALSVAREAGARVDGSAALWRALRSRRARPADPLAGSRPFGAAHRAGQGRRRRRRDHAGADRRRPEHAVH